MLAGKRGGAARTALSICALSVGIASSGHAQEIALDGIVITASKVEEAAIDALGGASSVSGEQINEQFNPLSASDVLRTVPGVTTQTTARDTGIAVNIRGLQDFGRVNVLIDGVRQNFQRAGHSANGVVYIEPEMISQIDVTKGPTSVIYGSGAIGGVAQFNLITADDVLRPGETSAARIRGFYGLNGPTRSTSATGAVKFGNFDIVGQINGRWNDNYEDGNGTEVVNSNDETDSKLVKARWRLSEGHELTGTVIDFDSEFTDRIEPLEGTQRASEVDNMQYSLGYTWDDPTTDLINLSAKVYRNTTRLDQTRLESTSAVETTLTGETLNAIVQTIARGPFLPPLQITAPFGPEVVQNDVFVPVGATRFVDVETQGFDVFNTSEFDLPGTKVALTYGADGFEDRVTSVDIFDNQDEFTPTGERTVWGSFVQAKVTFNDIVDVIGAVRYDDYELDGSGVNVQSTNVAPKATVAVTPLEGITVFATYAEGFRAPAVSETLTTGNHPAPANFVILPNAELRPETSENIEGGVNLKFNNVLAPSDVFRMKVVGFRNEVDDFIDGISDDNVTAGFLCNIDADPCPVANVEVIAPLFQTATFQFQNRSSVLIRGIELEAAYDASWWFGSIAAHRIRGKDQQTGEGLRTIPADQVTITAGFRALDEKLVAGFRARLASSQDRFEPEEGLGAFDNADGYGVVDLFGQYDINDNMRVNVNIDNVFDQQYRVHLDQDPSPGFSARAGLTVRLGAE